MSRSQSAREPLLPVLPERQARANRHTLAAGVARANTGYYGFAMTSQAFSRRSFLGASSLLAACSRPASVQKPNIVLVISDDQGYGDLGCHGNPDVNTPNIDRFHAGAVRFTDFHVDPLCAPTRAGLLTGRYAFRCGVTAAFAGRSIMRLDETTLAEILQHNGYSTGLFGKWHLGDNFPFRPNERGFDEAVVCWSGGATQAADAWGNDYFDDRYSHNNVVEQYEGYCTDVFFREGLEWIEKNRERPFFAYFPLNAPHRPLFVDESYSQPYEAKGLPPETAAFYGMIENIDENLGAFRARLAHLGLIENTIFIFMTDNGTGLAEPSDDDGWKPHRAGMRARKGSAYDGGHRVPFFVQWPAAGIGGGRDVDRLAAGIDVTPTLIQLADLELAKPIEFDGHSLAPLLRDEPGWPDGRLYFTQQTQIYFQGERQMDNPQPYRRSAVLDERWRLVDGKELYDINADPEQATDLADTHPEEAARLRAAYDQWWAQVSGPAHDYVEIPLGAEGGNPTRLTSFDWRPDGGPPNQAVMQDPELYRGYDGDSFWAVRVEEQGRYAFTLMERPPEADHPIEGVDARIRIGPFEAGQPIPSGARSVRFETDLEAGSTKLWTWFDRADGSTRGAYFVDVERLLS